MRRPQFIARQSRCPSGLLGRVIGRIMALETAAANAHALELLALEPTDHLLEVGFGHGLTIERAAARTPRGLVAGVDVSEAMMSMAADRNRREIAAGRVVLKHSDGSRLPFPDRSFDKALAMHVLYFWPEPSVHLAEILRVLKPGGRVVLGCHTRSDERSADFPREVYRFYEPDDVEALLAACGFRSIAAEFSPDRTLFVGAVR